MLGVYVENRILGVAAYSVQAASVTLYDQDIENPAGFVIGSGWGYSVLSQQSVNSLYDNRIRRFGCHRAAAK